MMNKKFTSFILCILFLAGCESGVKNDSAIYQAIKIGDMDKAINLIEKSPLKDVQDIPNYRFMNGNTPLHLAAKYKNAQAIFYFIHLGVPVNKVNNNQETPLLFAIKNNACNSAEALLIKGADSAMKDKSNNFPLLQSVVNDNYVCANTLLRNGADAKTVLDHNWNLAHIASLLGRNNILLLLMEYGANPFLKTDTFTETLYAAHLEYKFKTFEKYTNRGWNGLHLAILNQNINTLFTLYKKTSPQSLLEPTKDGQLPLHLAVISRNLGIIQLLVHLNNNVDLRNAHGETPLMIATMNKDIDIIKYLISKGANPKAQNNNKQTCLDIAKKIKSQPLINFFKKYE